jgi:hypothetical protein
MDSIEDLVFEQIEEEICLIRKNVAGVLRA